MNHVEIINLIGKNYNDWSIDIEPTKFIINFKYKTANFYEDGYELKPRERIYEFKRVNCAAYIKLLEEY